MTGIMVKARVVDQRASGFGALATAYGAFGYFWGCWVVVFSDFLQAHDLTPGQGSLRFVALSVTAIMTMTLVAPRLEEVSRGVLIAWALVFHAVGALLIAWSSTAWLVVAFGITGIGTGLIDVFVNAAGERIEARSSRSVLQRVHAAYGIGAAIGAVATGIALTLDVSFVAALAVAAVAQGAAALWCVRSDGLRVAGSGSGNKGAAVSLVAFRRWPYLLAPAVVVMAAFFIEGSMDVWSVIYLRRDLGASELAGSGGFAAFALSTAAGRLFASRILFGIGYRRTIFWSGVASGLAGALAVTTTHPTVASLGFLLLGFAMSSSAPAAFGLAGETGQGAGLAIAAMTTVGYSGFVLGPPMLGWLADQAGLRATMAALMVATLAIVTGGFLGRRDETGAVVPRFKTRRG
ncbi:MAG: sugar MFS transporter [Actinomycetota bacterium]